MSIKMKLKHLLTISLAVLLSACSNQNSGVPIQANNGGYDNDYNSEYQNAPLTNIEALATGVVTGVATGYAFGKYANKPRYSESNKSYGKPVVVVNKHYYQSKPKVRVSRYKRK